MADGDPCSRCKTRPRKPGSSWCRECLNQQAADYRERTRPRPVTEERVCALDECEVVFTWNSMRSKQLYCSRSHWEQAKAAERRGARPDPPPEGFFTCSVCGRIAPREELPPSVEKRQNASGWCRPCRREKLRSYRKHNRHLTSSVARRTRSVRLLGRYGAPETDTQVLIDLQGGVCATGCGATETTAGTFHIDHDHARADAGLSSYRGMVCSNCNVGLGYFNDDPELMVKAAEYIITSRSRFKPMDLATSEVKASPVPIGMGV